MLDDNIVVYAAKLIIYPLISSIVCVKHITIRIIDLHVSKLMSVFCSIDYWTIILYIIIRINKMFVYNESVCKAPSTLKSLHSLNIVSLSLCQASGCEYEADIIIV